MRKTLIGAAAVTVLSLTCFVRTVNADDCNWGELTADSIAAGLDQGAHASDPAMDGNGPEDRVGLANVVERGNLEATCELIAALWP